MEYINCFFNYFYTSFPSTISYPYVISDDTNKLTQIPIAGINSTYNIDDIKYVPDKFVIELHPIISEAQVDSANDPNKSAPIPAMSPTLSPTLSAMVAGLRGLSSGSPL